MSSSSSSSPPNYMDDVPVKISEKFRPPPPITLPQSIINRLNSDGYPSGCFDYDFTLERNVIKRIDEWRRMREVQNAEREERLRKLEIQKAKEFEVKQKEMLTAVTYPSAEDLSSSSSDNDENTESPEEAKTSSAADPPIQTNIGGNGLTSNLNTNQFSLNYNTILMPTQVPESISKSGGIFHADGNINYSDFENLTVSPFDNCELNTINDLDVLAQVLNNQKIHSGNNSTENSSQRNNKQAIQNTTLRNNQNTDNSNNIPNSPKLLDGNYVVNSTSMHNTDNGMNSTIYPSQLNSQNEEVLNKNVIRNQNYCDMPRDQQTLMGSPIPFGSANYQTNQINSTTNPWTSPMNDNQIYHHTTNQQQYYNYYQPINQQQQQQQQQIQTYTSMNNGSTAVNQQQIQNYTSMNGGSQSSNYYNQLPNNNQNNHQSTLTNYFQPNVNSNYYNSAQNVNYQPKYTPSQYNFRQTNLSPQFYPHHEHDVEVASSAENETDKKSHKTKSKSVPDIVKELNDEIRDSEIRRTRNHSQTLEDYCEKLNQPNKPDCFIKLSPSSQLTVENISAMGFSLELVSKIAQKLGNDDKKIIEHLIPLSELLDLGFDENKISDALLKFNNNKEKALDFLIS